MHKAPTLLPLTTYSPADLPSDLPSEASAKEGASAKEEALAKAGHLQLITYRPLSQPLIPRYNNHHEPH